MHIRCPLFRSKLDCARCCCNQTGFLRTPQLQASKEMLERLPFFLLLLLACRASRRSPMVVGIHVQDVAVRWVAIFLIHKAMRSQQLLQLRLNIQHSTHTHTHTVHKGHEQQLVRRHTVPSRGSHSQDLFLEGENLSVRHEKARICRMPQPHQSLGEKYRLHEI